MSGMDGLTELLPCPFCGGPANGIVLFKMGAVLCDDCGYAIDRNKASEAAAAWNRRASQAAPAPVAWQHVAASIQAHQIADGVVSGRLNRLTAFVPYAALKAAPAPSDGLREAAQTLLDGADTGSLAELHHAVSDLFGVVDGSDQEDDLFNAILEGLRYTGTRVAPAPAQEGGK